MVRNALFKTLGTSLLGIGLLVGLYIQLVVPALHHFQKVHADWPGNNPSPVVELRSNQLAIEPSWVFRASNGMYFVNGGSYQHESQEVAPLLIYDSFPTSPNDRPLVFYGPESRPLKGVGGMYSDGTKLYISDPDNHRVLVYNTIPTTRFKNPDVVLGQPNATTNDSYGTSAASLQGPAGIWKIGTALYVVNKFSNRISVWNDIDLLTNASAHNTPADVVLGQVDATSSSSGSAPGEFSNPTFVQSDGTRLVIADTGNNRVVMYDTIPTITGIHVPSHIITGDNRNMPVSLSFSNPESAFFHDGDLYVSDTNNNRIVLFTNFTFFTDEADFVFGQFDTWFASFPGSDENSLENPMGLFVDGTTVYIADKGNNRVLGYNNPQTTDRTADTVIGQFDWTGTPVLNQNLWNNDDGIGEDYTRDLGYSTSSIAGNISGALSDSGAMYVYDSFGGRVLKYNTVPTNDDATANLILSTDDTTFFAQRTPPVFPNNVTQALTYYQRPGDCSDGTGPEFMDSDGNVVAITDSQSIAHRVLFWTTEPTTSGQNYDMLFGQPDFTTSGTSATSATTLYEPKDIALDGNTIAISDSGHNRVLIWRNGLVDGNNDNVLDPAEFVIGQDAGDFTLSDSGSGSNRFSSPRGIEVYADQLFVTDAYNNRVLIFDLDILDDPVPPNGYEAYRVLGQPDFNDTNSGNELSRMSNPSDVAYDGQYLFVADRDNNRVLVWDGIPTSNGASADFVIGASTSPFHRSGVWSPRSLDVKDQKLLVTQGIPNSFNVNDFRAFDSVFATKIFDLDPLGPDTLPPYSTDVIPDRNATLVNVGANITFTLNDLTSGVDVSTLHVVVDGTDAVLNGVCQPGFACTIGASGNEVDVVINPNSLFPSNSTVNIEVSVYDFDGPYLFSESYSFSTNTPPNPPSDLYVNAVPNSAQQGFSSTATINGLTPVFSANYYSNDGYPATHYQFQVTTTGDTLFATPLIDSTKEAFDTVLLSGQRSPDLISGNALPGDGTYLFRVCFWDMVNFPDMTMNAACTEDTFIVDTTIDNTPPYISATTISNYQSGVTLSPTITVTLDDNLSGVNYNSLYVDFDGNSIVNPDAGSHPTPSICTGYYVTCSLSPSGNEITFSFVPDAPLNALSEHYLNIYVEDLIGNSASYTINFVTTSTGVMPVNVVPTDDTALEDTSYTVTFTPELELSNGWWIELVFPANADVSSLTANQISVSATNTNAAPSQVIFDTIGKRVFLALDIFTDNTNGDPITISLGADSITNPAAGVHTLYVHTHASSSLQQRWETGSGDFTITAAGNSAPTSPTALFANTESATAQTGLTNPTNLNSTDVVFSAIHHDPDGDVATRYRIQIDDNSDFSSPVYSNDGGTLLASHAPTIPNIANGQRNTVDITTTATLLDGVLYYWRIKFWDDTNTEGAFSSPAQFTIDLPTGDTTDPVLFASQPVDGATSVALSPSFSYTITDDVSVSITTVSILIEGEYAVLNGVLQPGFAFTTSPGGNAASVTYAFTRNMAYTTNGQVIDVTMTAEDTSGNPLGGSAAGINQSFTLIAAQAPAPVIQNNGGGSGGGFTPSITIQRDGEGGSLSPSDENGSGSRPTFPAASERPTFVRNNTTNACRLFDAIVKPREYSDVKGTPMETYTRKLLENSIDIAQGAAQFGVEQTITRSELLRIMIQANCADYTLEPVRNQPFPDVPVDHKDAVYIQAALQKGIVSGYGDGMFRPDNSITRAEILKVLLEAAFGKFVSRLDGPFEPYYDVTDDQWYSRYVRYAVMNGLAASIDGVRFMPNSIGDRAYIALTLYKILVFQELHGMR